ncbi:hypothetical protein B0H16DRAFT_1459365 [Mycena metata]|uniref:Uncharacterized protein n=1 Tax=Mycena metata TaxID=1033252 RepID=A0AAD7IZ17_9AGAR|nr:hypothetical protein B0H16DRAFT_1459365 [Mycena metata]
MTPLNPRQETYDLPFAPTTNSAPPHHRLWRARRQRWGLSHCTPEWVSAPHATLPFTTRHLKGSEATLSVNVPEPIQTVAGALCALKNKYVHRPSVFPTPQHSQSSFNPEVIDTQYLRFADGKEGEHEILKMVQIDGTEDEADEEEPEEPQFEFNKKDALAAAELLEKVMRQRPDFEMALPLGGRLCEFRTALRQEMEESKVQTDISSFTA